jgi:biopolymer transport protein ExbB
MGKFEISAIDLLIAGGPIMIPIFFCSIISFGIIIHKLLYFRSITSDTLLLRQKVFSLLKTNKIHEAVNLCNADPSPVARVLKAGILKSGFSRDNIKEAIEDVSLFEIPKLENRFTALYTIAHVAPLLGLLGTVTGMTKCFFTIQGLANSLTTLTPGDLAGGIAEALITTIAGLTVAIITFTLYNYLVSRVNDFIADMENTATALTNLLCHFRESGTCVAESS